MIDFYHDRDIDYRQFKKMMRKDKWENAYKEKGGQTFAVEKVTNLPYLMDSKLSIRFGVARCHKEDNFVKKIGRDLAVANMKDVEFTVVKIIFEKGKCTYTLESDKYTLELMFMKDKPFSRLEMVESK